MQINSLKRLLKDFKTPPPERSKVVGNPVWDPVNRQAALILSRCPPMPPEKLRTRQDIEIERLKAELKIERNSRAAVSDQLGCARAELSLARKLAASLQSDKKDLLAEVKRLNGDHCPA